MPESIINRPVKKNELKKRETTRPVYVYLLLLLVCCVPFLGGAAGIAMLIVGTVVYNDKAMAVLGGLGIFITTLISVFFWFAPSTNTTFTRPASDPVKYTVERDLTGLVNDIETYRAKKGSYPASLKVLMDGNFSNVCVDRMKLADTTVKKGTPLYYYELVDGKKYYLFASGKDGKPFTDDDILPPFHHPEDFKNVGLIPR